MIIEESPRVGRKFTSGSNTGYTSTQLTAFSDKTTHTHTHIYSSELMQIEAVISVE